MTDPYLTQTSTQYVCNTCGAISDDKEEMEEHVKWCNPANRDKAETFTGQWVETDLVVIKVDEAPTGGCLHGHGWSKVSKYPTLYPSPFGVRVPDAKIISASIALAIVQMVLYDGVTTSIRETFGSETDARTRL